MKNQVLYIARKDVDLPAGHFFLADLIGLEVRDADTGNVLGHIAEVLTPPANNVYVVKGGERELLIPAVPDFVPETNVDSGYITVRLIEGL
ncbi:MAG: 16S rRNA processing protein RimM, partial [Oscillospiraceae bacterium]|nr:16S rRNA processing protein RimM [Oscillospiraceae bacterium]